MMKDALGLIEIKGLATAVLVADTMVKTANVSIIEVEKTRGLGWMTVKIQGDVAAVTAAIQSGKQAGETYGHFISCKVIPRPSEGVEHTFCQPPVSEQEEKAGSNFGTDRKTEDSPRDSTVLKENQPAAGSTLKNEAEPPDLPVKQSLPVMEPAARQAEPVKRKAQENGSAPGTAVPEKKRQDENHMTDSETLMEKIQTKAPAGKARKRDHTASEKSKGVKRGGRPRKQPSAALTVSVPKEGILAEKYPKRKAAEMAGEDSDSHLHG